MDTFIELQLKTGGIIAVSVLLYILFLARDSFFNRNRAWLVATLFVPWIMPLLAMPLWLKSILFEADKSVPLEVYAMTTPLDMPVNAPVDTSIDWSFIGLILYAIVCSFMMIRLLWGYWFIMRLRKKGHVTHYKGYHLVLLNDGAINPFSFFRTIFIPEHLEREKNGKLILEHERTHCAQLHSIDISLAEWLLIIQWWNPFAWWLRTLIAQNHEYCVDNAMVKQMIEPKYYQYSLISLLQGTRRMQLVNNYNQSLTKKRLVMMNKKNTNQLIGWGKGMLLLPLVIVALLAFTNPDKTSLEEKAKTEINNESDLHAQIARTIKYPLEARDVGYEGTVSAYFKVDKKGKIGKVSIGNKADAIKLEKVVVATYANEGYAQGNIEVDKSFLKKTLEEEVIRVLNSLPVVKNNDWLGHLLQIEVQFIIQRKVTSEANVRVIGYGVSDIYPNDYVQDGAIGNGSINEPYILIDGEEFNGDFQEVEPSQIESVTVLRGQAAIEKYGSDAKDGAIEVTLKKDGEGYSKILPYKRKINKTVPMFIIDGKELSEDEFQSLPAFKYHSQTHLKGQKAVDKYGEKARNGVVEIFTKDADGKIGEKKMAIGQPIKMISENTVRINSTTENGPLYVVDGVKKKTIDIDPNTIDSVSVLRGQNAIKMYGNEGANGVVEITTKEVVSKEGVKVIGYGIRKE